MKHQNFQKSQKKISNKYNFTQFYLSPCQIMLFKHCSRCMLNKHWSQLLFLFGNPTVPTTQEDVVKQGLFSRTQHKCWTFNASLLQEVSLGWLHPSETQQSFLFFFLLQGTEWTFEPNVSLSFRTKCKFGNLTEALKEDLYLRKTKQNKAKPTKTKIE